jgi:MFS family permease
VSHAAGEATAQGAVPARRGAVAFIFVTILLDLVALGVIMPVLPKLIEGFVDNDTAQAARIFGLFGTAWALMQFVFSPLLGALSHRFGRVCPRTEPVRSTKRKCPGQARALTSSIDAGPLCGHFFTSGQSLSLSGLAASSAEIVAICL